MTRHLKDDTFARRSRTSSEADRPRRSGLKGPKLLALMLISLALLVLSRLDHSLVRSGRNLLSETVTPVLSIAMVPFAPVQRGVRRIAGLFEQQQDLDRLRDENQRLKGWEGRAKELERRIVQLDQLAKVVPEPGLKFATARVIADANGPFARAALIDAGREHGFKSGYPVINADGLVGRLVIAGKVSSRLLLLTDLNSRVPVYIGASSIRAIMLGDNGAEPRLGHIAADAKLKAGDDVITSGVGGFFPRGLKIGTVVDTGDQYRVELHARLDRLEYVSVLFFDAPGRELAEEERSVGPRQSPARRTMAGRPSESSGQ